MLPNPQQQQTTIDQLPDEKLATYGWNLRETQDGHRKQVEVIETNLAAIRQEFQRRNQLRQDEAGKEEVAKKTEREMMLDELMARLSERNGHPVPTSKNAPDEPATEV